MNHVYRLCWNHALRALVPASELATNHGVTGPSPSRRRVPLARTALAMSLVLCGAAWAGNAPTGGQIVGGSGQITQSGETTTIQQQSNVLSLDWQGFDIGAGQTVNFLQPGRDAIAVNRILGNTASDIQGHLNANGQVWLINPNGVLFGQNAQVNVGGLVASTLDVDDASIGSDSVRFAGNGRGSVVNRGSINVAPGGYAALLGNTVSNQGTIRAQLGTVALAGGTAVTLTFNDSHLMHLVVDANTVRSLVENRQLIVADGGQVLMTAGARGSLIASAVNNTGTVQARTVAEHDGVITLLSGMEAGTTNVAGTLDASAPEGGKGGFIETSGAQVQVADDARITTLAASGQHGTWLVDPTDFTIAASGGDITAAALQSQLASGNVTFTSAQGASGTAGNVNVNQAVSWSASTTLTLTASNNVNLNANITNTGASGKTVLNAGNAFVNNTGAGALGGNWEIYSANPAANTLGGLAPGFIQYGAPQGTAAAAGATGNGLFYSAAATLDITGFNGAPTKSYDGTGNLLVGNLAYTLSGSGDTLKAITGGYSQSDVGTGLTVKAPTAISAYTILNGGTPVFGYTVSGANSASITNGSITQASLTIGIVGSTVVPGANSLDKVYDGTNNATLNSNNYQISGLAPGEKITVNQPSQVGYGSISGNTITPTTDVDNTTTISAIFTNTNFVADSGTKLSNYNLTGLTATGIGHITPAPVYLSGIFTQNKTYDATISAPIDKSNASIFGIVNNDAVTLDASAGIGTFADANAGNGKAVTLSGFTLVATGGAKTSNYNLIVPANLTANIGQRGVNVYGLTVGNKVYDGSTATTAGELDLSGISFAGAQGTDSLKLDQTNVVGTFSQADVGNNLAVSVSGLVVQNSDGTANNNYVIGTVQGGTQAAPSALLANITPRALTISFNGSADKIYDGTSYATLSTGNFIVTGMAGTEVVSVNQAPATYVGADAPNVGTNQVTATLQSSDLNFGSGAKAGNYTFNTSVTGTGSITPAPLTLVLNGNPNKVYDGNSSATVNAGNFALYGAMPGENIILNGPFAASYYSGTAGAPGALESNVGNWLVQVALGTGNYGFTPSITNPSGSLGNYILPMLASGYGSITPKAIGAQITAGISGASKVYDGNTSITLGQSNIVFTGFLNGDGASVSTVTGTLADKNVGTQPLTALLNGSNTTFTCGAGGSTCLSNYTYDATQPPTHTLNDAGWQITAYGSGQITPKDLYIALTGVTKQYNGNTTVLPLSNGNFVVSGYVDNNTGGTQDSGWVTGEGATITPTASFTYASPNVSRDVGGAVQGDIPVTGTLTWNNYAPNGSTDLRNYNLVYNVTGLGEITPAPLYVDGIYAQNKIYDGGTGALINITNGQIAGLADVDKNAAALTVNIGNSTASTADGIAGSTGGTLAANGAGFSANGSPASGTFVSMNVSAGQQNVSTAFSLTGTSAGNYTLAAPLLTAKITPRPLTVSGITANSKTYDGSTAATFTFGTPTLQPDNGATGTGVAGLLVQDSGITLDQASGTGTFATANANADVNGNLLNPSGSHINVTASGFTLSGDPNGNYALAQPSGLSADIKQKPITLALVGPISKVYDGSKSVTIPVGNNQSNGTSTGYQTSGWVAGEGATLTQTHSAAYVDANATVDGSGNNISADGKVDITANLVSSDWQPGSGTMLSNYALPTKVTAHVGLITPLVLNLSATRIYDTTANIYASLSGNATNDDNANVFGTLAGLNGDRFTVTGQGTTSSKNVGTYTNGAGFGLGTLALAPISGNASNYTLVGGIDSYTITRAALTANFTASSKIYDGTAAATIAGTMLSGQLAGDDVTLDDPTLASFSDKNAGTGKTVTGTMSVSGADVGNYAFTQGTATADITPKAITAGSVGMTASNRQYNGTTNATVSITSSDVVGGDQIAFTPNGGAHFAQKDVGNGLTVTSNGILVSGTDAGNYTVVSPNAVLTALADITPRVLNLSGTRVYDGTQAADAGTFNGGVVNGVGSETLALTGSYTLGSKNAGSYNWTGTNGNGLSLADGTNGGLASNYTLVGGADTYTVTKRALTATFDAAGKDYDGNTDAVLSNAALVAAAGGTTGLVSGDAVTLTNPAQGTFASPDVGTWTVTGAMGITGGDAANYTFTNGTSTAAIDKATLELNLDGTRQYDGTGVAHAADFNGGVLATGVNGETLTLGGSYDLGIGKKDAGTYTWTYAGGLTISDGTGKANNYTLVNGTDKLVITPKVLGLSGTRVYDGSTNAAAGDLTTITGLIGGETVVLGGSGVLSGKNVNGGTPYAGAGVAGATNGQGFNLGTLALADGTGKASNYTLVGGTDSLILTPKQVIGTVSAPSRVYDGTTDAMVSFATTIGDVIGGVISGDDVNVDVGSAHFADKNAGNGKTVTASGIALSGTDAGNYTINATATTTANIYRQVLNLGGTRVYDGTTAIQAGKLSITGGLVSGETLGLAGTGVLSGKDVNGGAPYTGTGVAGATGGQGFNLDTLALTDGAGGLASNYTLAGGIDTFTITPKAITIDATAASKVYDGGTTATVTSLTSAGVIGGDTVSFASTGADFADADAANGKTVTVAGVSASGGDAGNYTFGNTATTTANITPKVLDLSGTRVYDGTMDAAASYLVLSGLVGSQTLALSGTGSVGDKNAGIDKAFAGLGDLALADGTNGGLAGNYTLVGGTDKLTITPKAITVDATAANKVYDGGTTATVTSLTSAGVIGGDTVTFASTGANFADADAANGKTVTVDGVSASGGDVGNYTFGNTATTTANITPYVLHLAGTRVYDATTGAYGGDFGTLAGLGGDAFTVSGAGVLASKNVGSYAGTGGTDFDLGTLGLVASSGLASNYTLVGGTDSYQVTPKAITVDATAANKAYDGGTTATVTSLTSAGVIGGDTVSFASTGADFADADAANGKAVTVDGVSASGGDAGNYTFGNTATTTANITPKVLDLSGTRVYDGGMDAAAGYLVLSGLVGSQTLALSGTGSVGDKNAGIDKAFAGLGDLALADGTNGGLAGNYTLVGGTGKLTITPKAITVDATAANKVYDGGTTATVTSLTGNGVLAGDTVSFASTGADFADANAANGKAVTVAGVSASGGDAGNYTFGNTATTTANITPKVLDLSGTRVYDTTAGADAKWFGNGDGTINGVMVGGVTEVLALSGSGVAGNADVGTYTRNPGSTAAPVAGSTDFGLGSFTLGNGTTGNGTTTSNGSLGNYTLVGGNDSFVITKAGVALDVSIAGGRQYDGTTVALSSDFGAGGVITVLGGQTLNLSGQGTLTNANVGSYQTSDGSLSLGSIALQDGTGKASNYTLTDGSFTVTQRVLGLSGTRVYDGSTNATASDITAITGLVTGETLGLTGTGVLSSKDVNGGTPYTGTGGAVGPQGFDLGTLALTNGAGGLASNYTLVGGSDALTITQRAISATFTGDNKVYDGTTVATVSGAALTQNGGAGVAAGTGLITGDKVTLTNPTQGSFADKNANTGITVTGDMGITGDDAGNYVFANGTATADITPKVLDLTGTRIYDTTTDAAAGDLKLGGLVGSETLVLGGQGGVTSKNVGSYTGGDFNLGSLGLADGSNGGLAGNYTLVGGTDTLTITPAPLTVSGITAASRTYDGTTAATVSGGTLHGVLGGDNVTLSVGGTGTFATPNAGTGIAVNVVTNLGGSDVGNYVLTSSGGAVADIYRKVLDLSGTRVYDGSTAADASDLAIVGGLVGSETLVLTGTGTLGDGNVGVAKPLAGLGTLALGNGGNGGLASNYTLVGGIDTLTITPYVLDLAGTRTYDGTTDADASSFGTDGMLAGLHGQTLQLTGTGSVADKNVGSDKPLTDLGTLALGDGTNGGLAGNYTLVGGIDTLTITPKTLTVVAVGTDKLYDGNTLDQVTLGTSDVLAGDSVQLRFGDARFSDPNIGRHKLVTVTGVQVGGADGGNYLLASPTVYTYADITGGQPVAFGIGTGTLVYLNSVVGPSQLATPYGSTTQDTVGTFNGNKQRRRQPVQRNGSRNDFTSGLALKVIDGGLRMPSTMAMP